MWLYGLLGGEVFYSPMVRSQYFCESVALPCEFHKCFSTLGGTGWLEEVEVGHFPFPKMIRY